MNQFSNNSALNKNIRANRLEIPFTLNPTGANSFGSFTASVDDEFTASCEIFVAATSASGGLQDGKLGGQGGGTASILDPSANDPVTGKAFPAMLSSDTPPCSIGLIVADGSLSKAPSTIPLENTDPSNPTYGTQTVDGNVVKVYDCEAVITDGGNLLGVLGLAARAQILGGGATPNGNIKVLITFQKYVISSASPTVANVSLLAAATFHGIIRLSYN